MSKIKLKDYQEKAVEFALNNEHSLYCMRVLRNPEQPGLYNRDDFVDIQEPHNEE